MKFHPSQLSLQISIALVSGAFAAGSATAQTASEDAALGVVTVTAQSRSQQAQAVPIPMQIVTSDQIDKLAAPNLSAMDGYIPGLRVGGEQPTQPSVSMRGIGTGDFGIGTDAPVGIYIDGVFAGKTGGALMNFNDLQRVEVLKGPQGTLFGRNSAGGAISVVTKEPSDELEREGHIRAAQFGARYIDALLNVPLNDTMAFRFTLVNDQSEGWLKDSKTGDFLNGRSDWGTRASLRWSAPAQTKVIVSWEHEKLDQKARPAIGLISMPTVGTPTIPVDPSQYLDPRTAPIYNDVVGNKESRDFDGVTLRIEKPLGWAVFNSTTAYRHFDSLNRQDNDGTNRISTYLDTVNAESNTTWQQEFKLSGKNDSVDWVAGVSAFRENAKQNSQINGYTDSFDTLFGNVAGAPIYSILDGIAQQYQIPVKLFGNTWQENIFNEGTYTAAAVYGDAIWHVTSKMNFTAGVRFTHDEKEFSWYSPKRTADGLDASLAVLTQAGLFQDPQLAGMLPYLTENLEWNNPAAATAKLNAKKSWDDVSPRFVLDYKVSPATIVFGSVSKGYQSGGFNALLVAGAYEPENVWNYEVGFKSYFRDQHLLLNASLFQYDFTNLQSLSLIAASGSAIPSYQTITSDQSARGLDMEARWQPTRNLRLFFSGEYIDQVYKNYKTDGGVDLSDQPVGTPSWSVAGGIDYTWRNIAGGSVNLSLQHAYTGATRCNADSLQGNCLVTPHFTVGEAKQRTDLRVGWEPDSRSWGVALFVNNLLDNRYVNGIGNTTASTLGTPYASISAPRVVGVEIKAAF